MDDRSPPEPDDLPEDLIHLIKPELQPGERLLWAATPIGRPPGGIRSPLIPFSTMLVSLGISLVAFSDDLGTPSAIFWVPEHLLPSIVLLTAVVGIGSGIVAVHLHVSNSSAHDRITSNTYALTDRRAIIWFPARGCVEVHSFTRGSIKTLYRLEVSGWVGLDPISLSDCGGLSPDRLREGGQRPNRRGFDTPDADRSRSISIRLIKSHRDLSDLWKAHHEHRQPPEHLPEAAQRGVARRRRQGGRLRARDRPRHDARPDRRRRG